MIKKMHKCGGGRILKIWGGGVFRLIFFFFSCRNRTGSVTMSCHYGLKDKKRFGQMMGAELKESMTP